MAPYEEVVIDADTSSNDEKEQEEEEEEEEVVVITPKSRKRRRQSTIMDEDDEGEQSQPTTTATPPPQALPAQASKANDKEEIDEDDDDDEVEIIQIASPPVRDGGSASKRKSRRLTILDSDEEPERSAAEDAAEPKRQTRSSPSSPSLGPHHVKKKLDVEPVRRQSLSKGSTPVAAAKTPSAPASATSSSRRSSTRIERKREEKEKMGSSARKLEFLSLDNCLDRTSSARGNDGDDDDDEFIVDDDDEDFEEEEEIRVAKPRKKATATRERQYADAGDDLDEFIVDDDDVEYMDDDEEGVMEQPRSSADEMDDQDDAEDVRAAMQSREPSEWFALYLRYLEECILDEELDNKMRTTKRMPEYRLFEQAKHHIERQICSRRDALRSSVVWNEDIMENLHCATKFHSTRCTATTDCQACRRANHYATQLVQFGGFACDARELYKDNWMKKLRRSVSECDPVRGSFELGSVCHARTLGYWQLLHAKHFWTAIVDAKCRECGDGHGRIVEAERKDFYKSEYGRYKRLINLVDKFSSETSQSVYFMPNVWKKVTAHHVHSEFLPSPGLHRGAGADAPRRGTMDSLVAESDDEETEDEVQEEEEEEEEEEGDVVIDDKTRPLVERPTEATTQKQADASETSGQLTTSTPRKRMRQSSLFSTLNATASAQKVNKDESNRGGGGAAGNGDGGRGGSNNDGKTPQKMKAVNEIEAEDLLCLVCRENQRDGAVAHGHYLHFYCCYRCAKRQHAAKHGCMVCDRPIDTVFRILPLSKEARADILQQQQQQQSE